MQKLIDGDRLERWLYEQEGMDAMLIQLVLADFLYRVPQTPMSKIHKSPVELVRRRDPGTSFLAALSITSQKRQEFYFEIYTALKTAQTDDELRRTLSRRGVPHSPSGMRSRRSELVAAGWVRDSGKRRDSDNGNPATVWEALPEAQK